MSFQHRPAVWANNPISGNSASSPIRELVPTRRREIVSGCIECDSLRVIITNDVDVGLDTPTTAKVSKDTLFGSDWKTWVDTTW